VRKSTVAAKAASCTAAGSTGGPTGDVSDVSAEGVEQALKPRLSTPQEIKRTFFMEQQCRFKFYDYHTSRQFPSLKCPAAG
jgi:hypothetical protein